MAGTSLAAVGALTGSTTAWGAEGRQSVLELVNAKVDLVLNSFSNPLVSGTVNGMPVHATGSLYGGAHGPGTVTGSLAGQHIAAVLTLKDQVPSGSGYVTTARLTASVGDKALVLSGTFYLDGQYNFVNGTITGSGGGLTIDLSTKPYSWSGNQGYGAKIEGRYGGSPIAITAEVPPGPGEHGSVKGTAIREICQEFGAIRDAARSRRWRHCAEPVDQRGHGQGEGALAASHDYCKGRRVERKVEALSHWAVGRRDGITVAPNPRFSIMNESSLTEPDEWHRRLETQLFNATWDLIDRDDRNEDDDVEMILSATASRWHWGQVGGPEEIATGDWQVSHVACLLGLGDLANRFASRCLAIAEAHNWDGWRLASAHEGMARACAVRGDDDGRARHLAAAGEALDRETDQKDRQLIADQIATVPETTK